MVGTELVSEVTVESAVLDGPDVLEGSYVLVSEVTVGSYVLEGTYVDDGS